LNTINHACRAPLPLLVGLSNGLYLGGGSTDATFPDGLVESGLYFAVPADEPQSPAV